MPEAHRRVHAEMLLEDLAVGPGGANGVEGPAVVEADRGAEVAGHAQQAPDVGVRTLQHRLRIGGGDAQLLREDECVNRPAHDVVPLRVALPHGAGERFLADDAGQDHVVVRPVEGAAEARELARIQRVAVAATGGVGLARVLVALEDQRVDREAIGARSVRQVQLVGGAGGDADGRAAELRRPLHARRMMKPWPSWKVIGPNCRPDPASHAVVQVKVRATISTWPD
ncbi:hypothetical protein [Roseomonas sp. KE2513]|uniref:hypothetical protein n=1 Tax=Roseomonas sp. KE2513 TaxID=2479202 RepID=UPI0018E00538|nr:hypothetical protein [Roseomonas sp. KE2513]